MITSEAIPGILITAWMILLASLIIVRRKAIAQKKASWVLSVWLFPAFAAADLVRGSFRQASRAQRLLLAAASFVTTFLAWLALFHSIGYSVMFKKPVIVEYVLMFAPGFTALLVWRLARRPKGD